MSKFEEKIVPESVIIFCHQHPRVVTFTTAVIVILTSVLSMSAIQLDLRACDWRKQLLADAQLAASEALGG
jgi:hypothetical protein